MGFWERLLRSSPVNNASGNNTAFPGVQSSREAVSEHGASEKTEISEQQGYSEDYDNTDAFDYSEEHIFSKDHDFKEEYASELNQDPEVKAAGSYSKNGVFFRETHDVYRLTYDGILAKDGACDVYAVVGTNDNGAWRDIRYYPMQKTDGSTFEVLFPVPDREKINVAFKDGADHWDNNSGRDYTYVKEGG